MRERKPAVLQHRFLNKTKDFPVAPEFGLALLHEVTKVIISAIAKHRQYFQLAFRSFVWLHLQSLRAVNEVFRHAHLQPKFNYVVVKAPRVQLHLNRHLLSYPSLQVFELVSVDLSNSFVEYFAFLSSLQQKFLVVMVDVELEEVVATQLLNEPLVLSDFVP